MMILECWSRMILLRRSVTKMDVKPVDACQWQSGAPKYVLDEKSFGRRIDVTLISWDTVRKLRLQYLKSLALLFAFAAYELAQTCRCESIRSLRSAISLQGLLLVC